MAVGKKQNKKKTVAEKSNWRNDRSGALSTDESTGRLEGLLARIHANRPVNSLTNKQTDQPTGQLFAPTDRTDGRTVPRTSQATNSPFPRQTYRRRLLITPDDEERTNWQNTDSSTEPNRTNHLFIQRIHERTNTQTKEDINRSIRTGIINNSKLQTANKKNGPKGQPLHFNKHPNTIL